jgi:hypothetical protein
LFVLAEDEQAAVKSGTTQFLQWGNCFCPGNAILIRLPLPQDCRYSPWRKQMRLYRFSAARVVLCKDDSCPIKWAERFVQEQLSIHGFYCPSAAPVSAFQLNNGSLPLSVDSDHLKASLPWFSSQNSLTSGTFSGRHCVLRTSLLHQPVSPSSLSVWPYGACLLNLPYPLWSLNSKAWGELDRWFCGTPYPGAPSFALSAGL